MPLAAGRPAVRLNMIVSVDGGTSWGGVSGALGGPADKSLFVVLRSLADLVIVAAGTMRAEGYGPATLPDAAREARRERGQAAVPPIAVVSRSCDLEWDSPFFTEARERPLVITVADAPARDRGRAAEVADLIVAGEGDVDFARALQALGDRGVRSVLAEGGPTLNGELARAGLLDELCVSLAPRLASGDAKRILSGSTLSELGVLTLHAVYEQDDYLFLRYRPQPESTSRGNGGHGRSWGAGMRMTRTVVLGVLIVLVSGATAITANAAPVVQRCTGPASTAQAGTADLSPGVNALAAKQQIAMKVHLAQCAPPPPAPGSTTPPPPTEVTGTFKTTFTTLIPQTCALINSPHTIRANATITWKNLQSSTLTVLISLTGSTRLANLSGSISAGVFAGHSVTGQYRYRLVVSPNGKTLTQACANKIAAGKPGRVSVSRLEMLRTKAFTVS